MLDVVALVAVVLFLALATGIHAWCWSIYHPYFKETR